MSHQRLALAIRKAIEQSYSRCIMEPLESRMLRTTMAADLVSVVPTATDDYQTTLIALPSTPAPPDYLDPTFASDGRATTDVTGGVDRARCLLIQPDGKFIVIGWSGSAASNQGMGQANRETQLTLARYNADGSLDTSFGDNGVVVAELDPMRGGVRGESDISASLRSDGKIVVGADSLYRFNADGSADSTFDGDGRVELAWANQKAFAVAANGKIFVGAGGLDDSYTNGDFRLFVYNADGSLDREVRNPFAFERQLRGLSFKELVVNADGSLTAIVNIGFPPLVPYNGIEFTPESTSSWEDVIVKFNADGTLDADFGVGGVARIKSGAVPLVELGSLHVLPDGQVLATGSSDENLLLVQLDADGSLDTSFGGGDGVVLMPRVAAYAVGHASAIQPDGKIVMTGWGETVYRFNPDGSIDDSFGEDGVIGAINGFPPSYGTAIAITTDGDILLVTDRYSLGRESNNSVYENVDFVIVRYAWGEPVPTPEQTPQSPVNFVPAIEPVTIADPIDRRPTFISTAPPKDLFANDSVIRWTIGEFNTLPSIVATVNDDDEQDELLPLV